MRHDQSVVKQLRVDTGILPLMESGRMITTLFDDFVEVNLTNQTVIICMEKMITGGQTGPLLFYIQMLLIERIGKWFPHPYLVFPLPVQLKSWTTKTTGIKQKTKTDCVSAYLQLTGQTKRVSSDIADAYLLARFGQEVFQGNHTYKPLSRGYNLFGWKEVTCHPQQT